MANYSQNDIMKMQQDATKRVLEMQERAKRRVEGTPSEPVVSPKVNVSNEKRNILDLINVKSLLKEQDTTLIAAILLMLSSEDTDPFLILAMLYVLM